MKGKTILWKRTWFYETEHLSSKKDLSVKKRRSFSSGLGLDLNPKEWPKTSVFIYTTRAMVSWCVDKNTFCKSLWRWSLSTRCAHKRAKRAPYFRKRASDIHIYSYISTRICSCHSDNDHWAPCVPAKEAKEPYIPQKSPYVHNTIYSAKEPHMSTKEPHMSTKEPSHLFIHIHKGVVGVTLTMITGHLVCPQKSQKSHIYLQKSHIYPQKSSIYPRV